MAVLGGSARVAGVDGSGGAAGGWRLKGSQTRSADKLKSVARGRAHGQECLCYWGVFRGP